MGDEILDVVSPATGEVIEQVDRDTVHAEGRWHQVFHCLVLRPCEGTVVLQRRSASKKAFPGLLDLSVTGHLSAGESPVDGQREFEEELGVDFDPSALVPIGTRLLADDNGEGQNRERVNLFFVLDDRPISGYRPPADEVDGLVEVTAADLLTVLADPDAAVSVKSIRSADPVSISTGRISRADLVEGADGYWVVLAVMAERALRGETLLAI